MPRYKAKNSITGEEVSFDWNGKNPPTEADVNTISDQQRQSRIATKEKIARDSEPSFMDKLLTSRPMDYALKAADYLGLDQPWHPVQGLHDVGEGMQKVIQGRGNEQYPRVAGAGQAIRGALGVLGPPGEAAGIALAPAVTLPAVAAGNVAARGTKAALAQTDLPPEVQDLASTGAGLVVGGYAGHTMSKLTAPKVSPPIEADPHTGALERTAQPQGAPPPRTRVNYAQVDPVFKELPAAPPRPPSTPYEQPAPPPTVDMTPAPPSQPGVPEFRYADRSSVTGATPDQPLLPEKGEPIPPPTVNFGKPPIQLPAAGETPIVKPPDIQNQPFSMMPRRAQGPALQRMPMQMPQVKVNPPNLDLFRGGFEPPADWSSQQRPDPVAPTEVSTVAPQPATPPTPPPGPPQAPPVPQAPPPAPAPVTSQAAAPMPQAPPAPPAPHVPPPAPQPPAIPTPPPAPPAAPPPAAAAPAAPTPPTQPIVKPPSDAMSIAQRAIALAKSKTAPEAAPVVKPPVEVKPITPELPSVKPPVGEESQLTIKEQQAAQLNNAVVDFLKKRKDVTIDQLQRATGVSAEQARGMLDNLKKRNLVSATRGKYNYIRARGEEAPEPTPDIATRGDTENAPSSEETPVQVSPKRQQRISDLQQQIGQAEDEGDTMAADVLRNHLQLEERNAKVEAKGTPEQKAQVKALDETYARIEELESKEESGSLTDEEQKELAQHYRKVSSLENVIKEFVKGESGEQMPSGRGIFGRYKFMKRHLEEPGEAMPRDVGAFTAKLGSANRVLRESGIPGAMEIGERTPLVEDLKHKFVGTYERKAADLISDLNKDQRVQVGKILDKFGDPERATGYDPKSIEAAIKVRDLLDEVHDMFPEKATKTDASVGYIPNYLTHIKKTLGSNSEFAGVLEDLMDYHLGPFKALGNLFSREPVESLKPGGSGASIYGQKGVGKPSSPFVERRTGSLEEPEYDVKRVLPIYLESAAKVIYDKPWIDKTKALLAQIPEDAPKTKELATAYLRNYARYDAYPGLQHAWDTATGRIMRVVGRSVLGFDTRLFALHSARLFANIFPELPSKYMAYGAGEVAKDPINAYSEVGRQGILPQNIRPWFFKRPMEKVDSVTNALSIFDFLPDGVAYHGFKRMYMDQGFSAGEASRMAANKTKDVSLRVTPARAAKFFSDDLGPLKPFTQFKQQVFKIAEQYATQPLDAVKRAEYQRLSRYLIGVGSMLLMYKKFHVSTWHLDPFHLSTFHAAAYDRVGRIIHEAAKGEIQKALIDAGILMTPGGSAIKNQLEKGKPSFMEDNE